MACIFASTNREPEFRFEGRLPDGSTYDAGTNGPQSAVTYPVWLQVTLYGSQMWSAYSTDPNGAANSFRDLGSGILNFGTVPPVVYIGIASTAHADGAHVIGQADLSTFKIVKQ